MNYESLCSSIRERGLALIRDNRLKICLISTYLLGMLAHAFFFCSTAFSHDSLILIYENDYRWLASLGRFGIILEQSLRGMYSVPWLIGIITLFYYAITAYLLSILFDLEKKYIPFLCGILTLSPSFTFQTASFVMNLDFLRFLCCWPHFPFTALIKCKSRYGESPWVLLR